MSLLFLQIVRVLHRMVAAVGGHAGIAAEGVGDDGVFATLVAENYRFQRRVTGGLRNEIGPLALFLVVHAAHSFPG